MNWDGDAEHLLATFCEMVPQMLRPLAEASARDASEQVAADRGATTVSNDDVIRGWIRSSPPEQRNGLVSVIEDLGFDPVAFADDLQSDEGWADEDPDSEA